MYSRADREPSVKLTKYYLTLAFYWTVIRLFVDAGRGAAAAAQTSSEPIYGVGKKCVYPGQAAFELDALPPFRKCFEFTGEDGKHTTGY